MTDTLLDVRTLSCAYGESQVLWEVDLKLERGKVMALIGRNGVGKTTLLHAIMGTRPTRSGAIHFSGQGGVPQHVFDLFPKLYDVRTRAGGFLSGGEQQQLAIGRALAGEPSLLLLDEPTEGIQPNVIQQIEAALVHVRDALGVTVLVVEQYLDFIWRFADSYCAMQGGRIVRQGSIAEESARDVAHLVQI